MKEFRLWQQVEFHGEPYSVMEIRDKTLVLKPHKRHDKPIEVMKNSEYLK